MRPSSFGISFTVSGALAVFTACTGKGAEEETAAGVVTLTPGQ